MSEIARLVNNLRAEGAQFRVEAVGHLAEIAGAFGPERTRREILPFLRETVVRLRSRFPDKHARARAASLLPRAGAALPWLGALPPPRTGG